MFPISGHSDYLRQTKDEKILLRDNYIRDTINETLPSLCGEILDNYLVSVLQNYCTQKGIRSTHQNMRNDILYHEGISLRCRLLLTFTDSKLVLVSIYSGVVFTYVHSLESMQS